MLTRTKLAIAATAATVALGAGGAAYAATSGGGTSPAAAPKGASGKAANRKAARRVATVEGKVTSDSATGGAFGQGVLTIVQPDGNQLTFSLRSTTKAVRYQGVGVKNVAEPATSIRVGEVVVVRAVRSSAGQRVARRIIDSGFAAS